MGGGFMSAPPEVETFEFEKNGVTYSVIRNKQTGENVSTPIPVKAPKGEPAETAGKVAMATGGVRNIEQFRGMLIDKDGNINREMIWKMWAPMGGLGHGRTAKSLFRDIVDARIRASTGAAINAEEIPYYESVYLPHPFDPDSTIQDKLRRFQDFLGDFLTITDPTGAKRQRIEDARSEDPLGIR
jgi:hypothetical protein